MSDEQLAKDLHKPIIRNFNRGKLHSRFLDNIWGADIADIQLINKFNVGFIYLLCVIDNYCKYTWLIPIKDKESHYNYECFSKNLKRI